MGYVCKCSDGQHDGGYWPLQGMGIDQFFSSSGVSFNVEGERRSSQAIGSVACYSHCMVCILGSTHMICLCSHRPCKVETSHEVSALW